MNSVYNNPVDSRYIDKEKFTINLKYGMRVTCSVYDGYITVACLWDQDGLLMKYWRADSIMVN